MPFNGAMLSNENVLASLDTLTDWRARALFIMEGTFWLVQCCLRRSLSCCLSPTQFGLLADSVVIVASVSFVLSTFWNTFWCSFFVE